jgi:RNA polymerase sigma-70 factor (ECF subfamily)
MTLPSRLSAAVDESALVARARNGDGDAFRTIMRSCNQRLFRIARSILRDDGEAEDAVQETYLRAFQKLGEFRGDSSILTWLTRIALNEARGRLRRRHPTVELDAMDAAQQETGRILMFPSSHGPTDPERDASRAEARRLLERAVDDLPEPFRVVFILREVDERSIEETAALLEIRPETVKTRLHRARRLLRRALDEKLASAVTEAFPFLGLRCERITERVLARLDLA